MPDPPDLTDSRWTRVDALFADALDRSPEDRLSFLERACGGDGELFDRVAALIRISEATGEDTLRPGSSVVDAAFSDVGVQLGAYRLLEPLGFGGMGAVYLAERVDGQFEQRVAIKVLRDAGRGPEVERRFLQERQILARLQHPNISRLLDGGLTSDGRPYFVMELVGGDPITEFCGKNEVDVDGVVKLIEQVGRAVDYAHGHGVIHRDLKPRNILVTNDGSVKLLDFGIAKLGGDDSAETMTRTGVYVLTPAYASPEQVRRSPVTVASDVYQLGLVLYELIAGRLPVGDSPTPPTVVAGGKRPTDLDRICLKALQPDVERRYAEAADLVEDIRRYRDRRPIAAGPDTLTYRAKKFYERNRVATIAGAALVVVSLSGGYLLGGGFGGGGSGGPGFPGWGLVLGASIAGALALAWRRYRPRSRSGASRPPGQGPGLAGPPTSERRAVSPTAPASGTTETDAGAPASSATETDAEAPDVHTVAVLPFETLGAEDTGSFSAGLYEDLLTELSRVSALTVISRTSAAAYQTGGKSISQIGRELRAGTVIEGAVRRAGDRVRLNVQVIDARRDVHRWAERYDRELTAANVFDLQSELVANITEAIRAELTPQEEARLARRPTDDLEAYHLYVEGRAQLVQRTEDGMRNALARFQAALARDPEYALAWAGLSEAVALLTWYDYDLPQGAPDAEEAARRAIRLDDGVAEAHMALGIVLSQRRDGPAMLDEMERAVELQPSHAEALIWLAWFHLLVGRPEDALEPTERATALNPLAPAVRVFRAEALLANADPERALREAVRAREIQPDYGLAHFMEGLVLLHLGEHVAAATALRSLLDLVPPYGAPRHAEIRSVLSVASVRAGDPSTARSSLADIREEAPGDPFWTGLALIALDEKEQAFAALERVKRWGWFETEALRYFFPDELGPLRDDARFTTLLRAADRSWGVEITSAEPETPGTQVSAPGGATPRDQLGGPVLYTVDLDPHTVAVLPFDNLSGTPDAEPFAAGLHDDVLTELSRISSLTVISRTSVKAYRDSTKPIPRIARELGAGSVIEGGVQRVGDRLRLNVQLIDARSDAHRWGERYDRDLSTTGIFDLQSELARTIAELLAAELSPADENRLGVRPTRDLEAYQLYLQGRGLFEQRTGDGMRRAVGYFERALQRDPSYALAWTGLADSLVLLLDYGHQMPADTMSRAEDATRRALDLDPELAEAHASRGNLLSLRRQCPEALRSHARAVELRPGYAQAQQWLGWVSLLAARPREALGPARRAIRLDPLSPEARTNLAQTHLGCGDPEKALRHSHHAQEIQAGFAYARWTEALAQFALGRTEAATDAFHALAASSEAWARPWSDTGVALDLVGAGDSEAAGEALDGLRSAHPFGVALVLSKLGQHDEALDVLAGAGPLGWSETLCLRYGPPVLLEGIRAHERYPAWMRGVDASWGIGGGDGDYSVVKTARSPTST